MSIGYGLITAVAVFAAFVVVVGFGPPVLLSWGEKPGDGGGAIAILTGPLSMLMGTVAGIGLGIQSGFRKYKSLKN
jgi:hypothetical protein